MQHSRYGGIMKRRGGWEPWSNKYWLKSIESPKCGFATERKCSRCRERHKVKNGTSQPEVLIGSMPESQRSKCQESTGWPGGQIITRFGNQFWAKVKWLVATEEKARRPGGAQGAKMTRFWKVIKNKINCLGFPWAAEACQSEDFVGEQGSKATFKCAQYWLMGGFAAYTVFPHCTVLE